MSYATKTDLQARFEREEVNDLGTDPDAPGVDLTVAALADAAAEIDAVLAQAYALPLPAGTYPALTAIQCDLARARLYHDATLEAPTRLRDRSMKLLRAMRDGDAELVSGAGVIVPRRNLAQRAGRDPVMTEDALAGLR